jgi:superfamily I DNA/RNA helicase
VRVIIDHRTFNKSVASLPNREKDDAYKALDQLVKNPNHPSLKLHPVRRGKSDFHTIRMNGGGRIVIHITKDIILACKAFSSGDHDDAYKYARTRIFKETASGLEYVSVTDNVTYDDEFTNDDESDRLQQADQLNYTAEVVAKPDPSELWPLFSDFSDTQIEECGITGLELKLVREITSEKDLFLFEESISSLAHDNLVALYLGDELPNKLVAGDLIPDPDGVGFVEYDGSEEIKAALTKPWASWLVFLSASQKQIVNANFKGSSKVFGGAGTGKTVVALHRAKRLAETTNTSTSLGIGLLTFSKVLANDLQDKADLLMGEKTETRRKVFVSHLDYLAHKAISRNAGKTLELTTEYTIKSILSELHKKYNLADQFTPEFVFSEYMNVIGPWGLTTFDKYKNFQRLGRQTPLQAKQREVLSALYDEFESVCYEKGLMTYFQLYQKAVEAQLGRGPIFDHIILDETQDLGPHMLAFVRSLVSKKSNDIMLCGDTGQSLYTRHHSFRKHGFDVQGKSRKLFVNYRTSRQIKDTADKVNDFLLELIDEPNENRKSISIFDGPQPSVKLFHDRDTEVQNLLNWIKSQLEAGVQPHEIVVLTPNDLAMSVASAEMGANNIKNWKLDASANYLNGEVGLAAVRRVKGLEYRSVAIIGCDEDQFPNSKKLNELGDGSDFDEFLTLEKNSLYVAMTRARDNLLVSGIMPGSPFLEELN